MSTYDPTTALYLAHLDRLCRVGGNPKKPYAESATAYRGGRTIQNNTTIRRHEGGPFGRISYIIRLHNTDVVTVTTGVKQLDAVEFTVIELDSGGWRSNTTADRINTYLPRGISLSSWRVHVGGGSVGFGSGMSLWQEGDSEEWKVDEADRKEWLQSIVDKEKARLKHLMRCWVEGGSDQANWTICDDCCPCGRDSHNRPVSWEHVLSHPESPDGGLVAYLVGQQSTYAALAGNRPGDYYDDELGLIPSDLIRADLQAIAKRTLPQLLKEPETFVFTPSLASPSPSQVTRSMT